MKARRVKLLLDGSRPTAVIDERIDVPHEIYEWKADPAIRNRAEEVQIRNRQLLQSAFARGLVCLGYERDSQGSGRFLLGRWDENWSYAPNP
jgi:hypothetical protein